jgi:hypothetical protein
MTLTVGPKLRLLHPEIHASVTSTAQDTNIAQAFGLGY